MPQCFSIKACWWVIFSCLHMHQHCKQWLKSIVVSVLCTSIIIMLTEVFQLKKIEINWHMRTNTLLLHCRSEALWASQALLTCFYTHLWCCSHQVISCGNNAKPDSHMNHQGWQDHSYVSGQNVLAEVSSWSSVFSLMSLSRHFSSAVH